MSPASLLGHYNTEIMARPLCIIDRVVISSWKIQMLVSALRVTSLKHITLYALQDLATVA